MPLQPDEAPPFGPTVHAVTVLAPLDEVRRAWEARAVDTGDVDAEVVFRPAPGDKGTEVIVRPDDPSAATGGLLDRLRGDAPHQRTRQALRELKATLEAGEVVTTEGQPTGRTSRQEALTSALTDRLRAWGAS
jgi:uncharacterized membrane protein